MWDFSGRRVLVTGASGGIGGATVRQIAGPIVFLLSDAASMITWLAALMERSEYAHGHRN